MLRQSSAVLNSDVNKDWSQKDEDEDFTYNLQGLTE